MNYKKLKKDELRELCLKKGLSIEGTNDDMIARLKSTVPKITTREIFPQSGDNSIRAQGVKEVNQNPFIQIKISNLSNYFSFGYIYPLHLEESEIYKTENRATDILTLFPKNIVAGYTPINSFNPEDALVEFIPNDLDSYSLAEQKLLVINQPIPVSRIISIYFKSEKDKASFIASVKTFPDNYVPESICKVFDSKIESTPIDYSTLTLPENSSLNLWVSRLDLFDKLMGLYAFIKNTGLLYAEKENRLDEYLPSFFSALNLINTTQSLSRFKENSFLRPIFKELEITSAQRLLFTMIIRSIKVNESFNIKSSIGLLEFVLNETKKPEEKTELGDIINHFKSLDKLATSFPDLLKLEIINRNYPVLILLFLSKFPNKSRLNTDKQAVRTFFIGEEITLPVNVAEYVLAVLGFYYGYKNMVKADTNLRFNDRYFQIVASQVQSIKFKLEDFLDRFIVESCFNYAVRQSQLNNTYDFLPSSDATLPIPKPILDGTFEYVVKMTDVLNHNVTSISKISKLDKLISELLHRHPDKIQKTSYLSAYFFKHFKLDLYYFIDVLKKNQNEVDLEELTKVIDLEKNNR
jgi:hypothetical protein